MTKQDKNPIAIYVHIPFCEKKCLYCSFVSFTCIEKQAQYFEALKNQINLVSREQAETKIVNSVYFGGGTPSFVESKYICEILSLLKSKFVFEKDCEISIECNPNSASEEKLKEYKSAGFNRISFGVQSFVDDELKAIGRIHSSNQAESAIKKAKSVGFENISCDILIGIPFQTEASLLFSIKKALSLPISHLSAYSLIVEEGTPICSLIKNNSLKVANDDESVDMIELAENQLAKSGFNKYEISNFAKRGFECKQNIAYWECKEYLGFGVAAHGYNNGIRTENTDNLADFLASKFVSSEHLVTTEEQQEERIMLGLRMVKGLDLSAFEVDFGFSLLEKKKSEIAKLEKAGLIKLSNNFLSLTKSGFFVCNRIILELI